MSILGNFAFTEYFEKSVLLKRPYLTKEMCVMVVKDPLKVEVQSGQRVRFWGRVESLGNRVIRVVTLADRVTIHNAFLDRAFKT